MAIKSIFKTCQHSEGLDWRQCYQCLDEVATNLTIARTYLNELANGTFNEFGDLAIPVAEPIRGQHFQRIAQTALSIIS